jgi:hypothetical protein
MWVAMAHPPDASPPSCQNRPQYINLSPGPYARSGQVPRRPHPPAVPRPRTEHVRVPLLRREPERDVEPGTAHLPGSLITHGVSPNTSRQKTSRRSSGSYQAGPAGVHSRPNVGRRGATSVLTGTVGLCSWCGERNQEHTGHQTSGPRHPQRRRWQRRPRQRRPIRARLRRRGRLRCDPGHAAPSPIRDCLAAPVAPRVIAASKW